MTADNQGRKSGEEASKDADSSDQNAEHDLQETLQEEFHKVWDETIKPALEQLKNTTEDVLRHFSDFEDDFRGYLRDREPDVDVELLEEIYGDALRNKSKGKASENEPSQADK